MYRVMTSLFIPLFLAGLVFAAEPGSSTKNEQEIRKTVEAYVQAYNLGDGAALASHWSRKGEFVSASGERLKGRDKIKPALEKFLQDNKGIQCGLIWWQNKSFVSWKGRKEENKVFGGF